MNGQVLLVWRYVRQPLAPLLGSKREVKSSHDPLLSNISTRGLPLPTVCKYLQKMSIVDVVTQGIRKIATRKAVSRSILLESGQIETAQHDEYLLSVDHLIHHFCRTTLEQMSTTVLSSIAHQFDS